MQPPGISLQEAFAQGVAHHQAGHLTEAEIIYGQVLARQPDHAEALHLLGVLLHQRGRSDEAIELIRRAVAIRNNVPAFYLNFGVALAAVNRLNESAEAFLRALVLKPGFPEAMANLSDVLLRRNQRPAAIEMARKALALRPESFEAANNLGNALLADGRLDEAITALRRAIRIQPNSALANYNLGNALRNKGDFPAAREAFRRAIALKPDYADAFNNLGQALIDSAKFDEAVEAFASAIQIRPDFAAAHNNYANAVKLNGFLDESIHAYQKAMELEPKNPDIRSSYIYTIFCSPKFTAQDQLNEQRKYNELFGSPAARLIRPHRNARAPGRRLKIGYVSSDFRNQISGLNALPLLKHHDRKQFEIFCYCNTMIRDVRTEEFRAAADHWRTIERSGDDEVAEMIRTDQIDILMDLNVHSNGNRLPVFARKPAPVQGTFIGYPGSTGLDAVDFRITDPFLDPPGESEQFYSEKCARVPDCFWCYDPEAMRVPTEPVARLPAEKNEFITFGCLNNFCKIHEGVLSLWARVMEAVKNSRLLLLAPSPASKKIATDYFSAHGVTINRLEFVGRQSHRDYMNTYNQIDLCLDTFPCSGHSTSLDSLWMGVPIVTLVGPTVVCRATFSQLSNLKMTQFAADNEDQFVKVAVEYSSDFSGLSGIREGLREKMRSSPLCDGRRFTASVESIYQRQWEEWLRAGSA